MKRIGNKLIFESTFIYVYFLSKVFPVLPQNPRWHQIWIKSFCVLIVMQKAKLEWVSMGGLTIPWVLLGSIEIIFVQHGDWTSFSVCLSSLQLVKLCFRHNRAYHLSFPFPISHSRTWSHLALPGPGDPPCYQLMIMLNGSCCDLCRRVFYLCSPLGVL